MQRASVSELLEKTYFTTVILKILTGMLVLTVGGFFLYREYSSLHGLTSLIRFGKSWEEKRISELRKEQFPLAGDEGYDGQFYAQIAVKGNITHPELKTAVDDISYRARRILLPMLAYVSGGGNPEYALRIYSYLNIVFFLFFLGLLLFYISGKPLKIALLIPGIMLSTGVLESVMKCLTDLPATFLLTTAVLLPSARNPFFLFSLFARETSLISIMMLVRIRKFQRKEWMKTIKPILWVIPFLLFVLILKLLFPSTSGLGSENLSFPWVGLWLKVHAFYLAKSTGVPISLFEFVGPLSLFIQSIYFYTNRDFSKGFYRAGLGFAILFPFTGTSVFAEHTALARAFLPMTVFFNLLIEDKKYFYLWFVFGNVGLTYWLYTSFLILRS